MHRLNWLFTFSSLSVLLVTIERFSFTTQIILQPYNYLRLHELLQMTVVILLTVIIPFLVFKEVSSNFQILKNKVALYLALLFIVGVYFYATGNGAHEIASFFFNNYCDTKNITNNLCGGLFFNDYYLGNIYYFLGGLFMNLSLVYLEKINPFKDFSKKDLIPLIINAVIYALAIFAYSAFDRVLVGLVYSFIMMIIGLGLFLSVRKSFLKYPIITYTATTYTLGTLASLVVRLLHK